MGHDPQVQNHCSKEWLRAMGQTLCSMCGGLIAKLSVTQPRMWLLGDKGVSLLLPDDSTRELNQDPQNSLPGYFSFLFISIS